MKIMTKPIYFPPLPDKILIGRIRKDGKPDMRYKNNIAWLERAIKDTGGLSGFQGGTNKRLGISKMRSGN